MELGHLFLESDSDPFLRAAHTLVKVPQEFCDSFLQEKSLRAQEENDNV